MPPEIADSDAESDIVVAEDETRHKTPFGTRRDAQVHDDATQKLSDLSSSTHNGTGSTDRLMRGVQEAGYDGSQDQALASSVATNSSKSKRAFSEVQDTSAGLISDPKSKRAKTYGSRTRDIGPNLFADIRPTAEEHSAPAQSDNERVEIPSVPAPEINVPVTSSSRERDRPRRVVSLLQHNATNPYHQVTTSMSSIGGYQSINLDFRGDGRGLDFDTNPFGSISQVSVEGPTDTGDMVRASDGPEDPSLINLLTELGQSQVATQEQMMTSPVRAGSPDRPVFEPLSEGESGGVDVSKGITRSPELGVDDQPRKRSKTDHTPSKATMGPPESTVRRAASTASEIGATPTNLPPPKKRGRPAKAKAAPGAGSDDIEATEGADPLNTLPHARPRASSMETSSQTSQISQPASNTKRKRKRTKAEANKEESKQHPSSELNLSDEQIIGLPKENYKPRPSRSRSKRTDEVADVEQSLATPVRTSDLETTDAKIETPASKPSTAKSKKSKVKRAKTSGAALLKPVEPMLSEGEDDVLWVESKPAAVKLDLPADIRLLKMEEAGKDDESADELQSDMAPAKNKNFSLEIPGPTNDSPGKKTQKKRGRKPTKASVAAAEASGTAEPETYAGEPVAAEMQDQRVRPALASKDANQAPPKATSKASKNAKSKAVITDSDDEDDENEPPPTKTAPTTGNSPAIDPVNPATTSTPSPNKSLATASKPTHSPLKSTSSVTASQRYRIGLSKRTKIPSLLRKVQRDKPPPTKTGVKVKELKIKGVNDGGEGEGGDDGDGEGKWTGVLRDKDGRLVEWDF